MLVTRWVISICVPSCRFLIASDLDIDGAVNGEVSARTRAHAKCDTQCGDAVGKGASRRPTTPISTRSIELARSPTQNSESTLLYVRILRVEYFAGQPHVAACIDIDCRRLFSGFLHGLLHYFRYTLHPKSISITTHNRCIFLNGYVIYLNQKRCR